TARLHWRFRLARGVAVLGLDKDAGDFGERYLDLALDTTASLGGPLTAITRCDRGGDLQTGCARRACKLPRDACRPRSRPINCSTQAERRTGYGWPQGGAVAAGRERPRGPT